MSHPTIKSARRLTQEELLRALEERKSKAAASPSSSFSEDGDHVRIDKAGTATEGPRAASDVTPAELRKLVERRGMPWREDFVGRTVAHWGSDERVDAHRDIVRQSWNFDEFKGNSPMPFSHGWGGLPVGRVIDWKVQDRKEKGYDGPALWLLGLYPTADISPQADQVFRLTMAGFFPGGSVGFWSENAYRVEDEEERKRLGLDPWSFVFEDNHLLEYSPTMLGANPGALAITEMRKARDAGLLRADDLCALREATRSSLRRGAGDSDEWARFEMKLRAHAGILFPSVKLEAHPELDVPFEAPEQTAESRVMFAGMGGSKANEAPAEDDAKDDSVAAALAAMRAEVSSMRAALDEGMAALMSVAQDTRECVEEMRARSATETNPSEEEEATEAAPARSRFLALLREAH